MRLHLLDEELGFFPLAGPHDRAALAVDLHHQDLGFFLVVAKNFHEYESDVGHEVDRIIVDHDVPRNVE